VTLTFEDHELFHRSAVRALAGAAAMGALAAGLGFRGPAPAAAAIAAGALAAVIALRRTPLVLAGVALLAAIAADGIASARTPLLAAFGAVFALGLADLRTLRAREEGRPPPSIWAVVASAALVAGAAAILPWALRGLGLALSPGLPRAMAWLLCGALGGLWLAVASAPLHLGIVIDRVEERLASVRALPLGELRALVDRIAASRRAALATLRGPAGAALRSELDGLTIAALDLARRGAELLRAAPPAVEQELARRAAELEAAAASDDAVAQASYRRAAESVRAQLEHVRRVRLGRERIAARLHEEAAQLERARFSLVLLAGADAERSAAEIDLLSGRLRQSATAFEAEAEASRDLAVAMRLGA